MANILLSFIIFRPEIMHRDRLRHAGLVSNVCTLWSDRLIW